MIRLESLVKFIYRDYGLSQCVNGRRAWCPTLRETSCSPLAGSASIAFRPFNVHRYDPGTLITHRTWYGIHRSKLLSISCLPHDCFSDANDLHSNMYRSRARRPHLVHPGPSVDMITRASRLHFGVEVLHCRSFLCQLPAQALASSRLQQGRRLAGASLRASTGAVSTESRTFGDLKTLMPPIHT
ncbi:hypothetical protein QCA50_005264 [Cerrena zonata]|uniref:Uncharacterized protein n=1 Tax=Cerrena zonata TaxID=2478898 RepID=A0AAW0GEX9_9APHY